jgi:hypothetical protein
MWDIIGDSGESMLTETTNSFGQPLGVLRNFVQVIQLTSGWLIPFSFRFLSVLKSNKDQSSWLLLMTNAKKLNDKL